MTTYSPVQLGSTTRLIATDEAQSSLPTCNSSAFFVTVSSSNEDLTVLGSTLTVQRNRLLGSYLQQRLTPEIPYISVVYDTTADAYWEDVATITAIGVTQYANLERAFFRVVIKEGDYVENDGTIICQLEDGTDATSDSVSLETITNMIAAAISTSLIDYVINKGTFNAAANIAYNLNGVSIGSLDNSMGSSGQAYRVTTSGLADFGAGNINLAVGDIILRNRTVWEKWIGAGSGGGSGSIISPTIQVFNNVDGADGVTVIHNLGFIPFAVLILASLTEGGDMEAYLIDAHSSVNQFTANWIGTRSGSIIYGATAASEAPVNQPFFNVDGAVGVTVVHNLGFIPFAELLLSPTESGGSIESSLIDEHTSVNQFTANWIGTRSGNILYGGSEIVVTPIIQTFTDIDGAVGVTVTHNLGYIPLAQLILNPLEEGGDLESSLIDEHESVNQFTANWIGTRSGSAIYYI